MNLQSYEKNNGLGWGKKSRFQESLVKKKNDLKNYKIPLSSFRLIFQECLWKIYRLGERRL